MDNRNQKWQEHVRSKIIQACFSSAKEKHVSGKNTKRERSKSFTKLFWSSPKQKLLELILIIFPNYLGLHQCKSMFKITLIKQSLPTCTHVRMWKVMTSNFPKRLKSLSGWELSKEQYFISLILDAVFKSNLNGEVSITLIKAKDRCTSEQEGTNYLLSTKLLVGISSKLHQVTDVSNT